jgi:hypothetical protein
MPAIRGQFIFWSPAIASKIHTTLITIMQSLHVCCILVRASSNTILILINSCIIGPFFDLNMFYWFTYIGNEYMTDTKERLTLHTAIDVFPFCRIKPACGTFRFEMVMRSWMWEPGTLLPLLVACWCLIAWKACIWPCFDTSLWGWCLSVPQWITQGFRGKADLTVIKT